jgi:mono/diheme cytochrome c family protein
MLKAKKTSWTPPVIIGIAILVGGAYLLLTFMNRGDDENSIVETTLPAFDESYAQGQSLYQSNCSTCHGATLGGKKGSGPPFVHGYYKPGHHADIAFYRAINTGVTAHHWQFGNMPAIPSLTKTDAGEIIRYIRAVQRANGIS